MYRRLKENNEAKSPFLPPKPKEEQDTLNPSPSAVLPLSHYLECRKSWVLVCLLGSSPWELLSKISNLTAAMLAQLPDLPTQVTELDFLGLQKLPHIHTTEKE